MCDTTQDEFTVEIAVEKLALYDDLYRATEYLAKCVSEASPFIDIADGPNSITDVLPFNSSVPCNGLRDALNTLALCRRLAEQIKNRKWDKHTPVPLIPIISTVMRAAPINDIQC